MQQFNFLVPTQVQDDFGDWLHTELIKQFKGYTRDTCCCRGYWTDPNGIVIDDRSVRYYVACENPDPLIRLLEQLAQKGKQQCIYLVLHTNNVLFVAPA